MYKSSAAKATLQHQSLLRQRHWRHIELSLERNDAWVAAEVAYGVVAHGQMIQRALVFTAVIAWCRLRSLLDS